MYHRRRPTATLARRSVTALAALAVVVATAAWAYSERVDTGWTWAGCERLGFVAVHVSNGAVSACVQGDAAQVRQTLAYPVRMMQFRPPSDVMYMTSGPPLPGTGWDVAGIRYRHGPFAGLPTVIISVPLMWFVGTGGTITVAAAVAVVGRRPRPGRCPACGYDLRATPGRCPECGTVVESTPI